jgi:MFS family permease
LEQLPQNLRPFRFWPVYFIVFFKAFYVSLYDIALPNYLIFERNISPSLVGIIMSVYPVAYIFAPLFGNYVTKKLNVRSAILISVFVSIASMTIQIFFFVPIVLIICRIVDGLCLGLFWPNLQYEMSNWQKDTPPEECEKYFAKYSFGWNFGVLCGLLLGFTLVIIWNANFIALIVACIFSFSLIPIGLRVEKNKCKLIYHQNNAFACSDYDLRGKSEKTSLDLIQIQIREKKDKVKQKSENFILNGEKNNQNAQIVTLSIAFAFFGIFIFGSVKSMYNFLYPFFIDAAGHPSYWVYLMILFQQFFQILCLRWVNNKAKSRKYLIFMSSVGLILFISLIMLFLPEIWFISIVLILIGGLGGIIYGISTQIMLEKGADEDSLYYATWFEVFSGIGLGTTQFIAGFLIEVNILLNIIIVIGIFSISSIILVSVRKRTLRSKLN